MGDPGLFFILGTSALLVLVVLLQLALLLRKPRWETPADLLARLGVLEQNLQALAQASARSEARSEAGSERVGKRPVFTFADQLHGPILGLNSRRLPWHQRHPGQVN